MLLPKEKGSLTHPSHAKGQVFLPSQRSLTPAPCSTRYCPAAPICGASEREPLLESPGAYLSLDSKFIYVFTILVPQVRGYYKVHQVEPPCLVRLYYLGGLPGIPDGAV
jgi:hypothetical protein